MNTIFVPQNQQVQPDVYIYKYIYLQRFGRS